jgi:dienelactone hydrolase
MLARLSVWSCTVAVLLTASFAAASFAPAAEPAEVETLAGTQPLTWEGDISMKMVDDLHKFADRETAASVERRARHWKRDFSSREAYEKSIEPNRARLAKYLGATDGNQTTKVNIAGALMTPLIRREAIYAASLVLETPGDAATEAVVLNSDGVDGDSWGSTVILLPDAGDAFERRIAGEISASMAVAADLVDAGLTVVIPRTIDRETEFSVVAKGTRITKQPHREFIYRQAFEMGRHVIGYEVDAVRSWVRAARARGAGKVGVVGLGEGGLVALYAAALDPSIDAAYISGYFGPREALHQEPIYRNVWGLLDEFGDAELATLVAPRPLVVDARPAKSVEEPNQERVTPGRFSSPTPAETRREAGRFQALVKDGGEQWDCLQVVDAGDAPATGSTKGVAAFLKRFSSAAAEKYERRPSSDHDKAAPIEASLAAELRALDHDRSRRQFERLTDHTQDLLQESEYVRKDYWVNADRKSRDPAKWAATLKPYRDHLYDEVLGRFELPKLPPNARTRKIYDTPKYAGYEVVLDVFGAKGGDEADVWAFGILLVPKDLKPGERRPVVVCQHGLEGRPEDTIRADVAGSRFYHEFAAKLADRGFVTFSPQNPYIGKNHFRQVVRKLNPLKKSLWSIIVPQHDQITDWLATLDFVDAERIGFYGLSYGGKTAMRVPALVERYCLSICSGDFNEWVRKCTSVRDTSSYMQTGEYEMFEFDLGHTFNYAEMAYLIAPRPFMVERGHRDGVGVDEWVSYEFAKVRLLYADLKIPERTEIEYFDGPHEIHAVGTFDFLHRHLNWPAPK